MVTESFAVIPRRFITHVTRTSNVNSLHVSHGEEGTQRTDGISV